MYKCSTIFLFLGLIIASSLSLFAQESFEDVVYLKNGSIIRGIIIEQVPGKSIKLKTRDGNIFIYSIDEVEKIIKERISQTSGERTSSEVRPLGSVGLSFQPLGFLQFGPVIQADFKVASNTVIGPTIRFFGLGLLSQEIVEYDELYTYSMSAGIQFKQFFENPNSPDRFYVGLLVEYGFGGGIDFEEYYQPYGYYYEDAEYDMAFIAVATNFGYRWRFDSGLFVGLGLLAGIAQETVDEMVYPTYKEYSLDLYFYGMVEISFGIEF